MNLIISFSGRANGNCDDISQYIATENDKIIKWFERTQHKNHVLGIERYKYGQKISDKKLDVSTVKNMLMKFINQ